MFGVNLARRSGARATVRPAAPPGFVVHAIGDIHGQLDLLAPLLEHIVEDAGDGVRSIIVCLGDYVDRGPSSREVIDTLLELSALGAPETRFLLGNHESALLEFLDNPGAGKTWFEQGGRETVASYGVSPRLAGGSADAWRTLRDELSEALPPTHLGFLQRLEPAWEIGDYFFAHAGARPGVALRAQALEDLLWIRQPFLGDRRPFDKVVVHGHTPAEEVHVDHRRIGLDTGAYATGVLSAIRLEGEQRRIVQARRGLDGSVSIEQQDV